MFFTDKKRKKNLLFSFLTLTFFCGAVFLAQTHVAHATWWLLGLDNVFKTLLVAIFTMFGWLASLALSIFEWAIKPDNVILLFNTSGVYESWKFVRDFFNLFFILVLLYIAFTVVFQINKDFKKALLSLVLAALFINFSFPVSRFLIDATNVPMYFFANQMMARNPGQDTGIFGGVMTASHLKGILIPGGENGGTVDTDAVGVARLLMAIVFMFLFSITLLVLSIMFVIRLVALVILVIFSSVGFAAAIIPGMEQYSKQWWDNFWKYALFGPAAMLMILVATRFFAALGSDSGPLMKSMTAITAGTTIASEQTFFSSMALFTIPIIMLWFAMGLAQKMSIAGASSVVGLGQKVSKWVAAAPFRAGWSRAKWAGRKLDTHILAPKGLSPKAWIGGVKDYFETQAHEDKRPIDMAKGRMHNNINRTLAKIPLVNKIVHADKVNYEFLEAQKQMREEEAELKERAGGAINENTGRVGLNEAYDEHEGSKALGSLSLLAKTNGLDNVVGDQWKRYAELKDGKWISKERDGKKILEISDPDADGKQEISVTGKNFDSVFKAMMEDFGITDEETQERHKYNLGEIAKANGDHVYSERATPDMKTGAFKAVSGTGQAEASVTQINKSESQAITRAMHGRTIADQKVVYDPKAKKGEEESRTWGDAHELAVEFLTKVNENVIGQTNRLKPEFSAALKSMWDRAHGTKAEQKEVEKFINVYNEPKNISARRFVQKALGLSGKNDGGDPGLIGASRTQSPSGSEEVSPGGIILPSSSGGGPRKNP